MHCEINPREIFDICIRKNKTLRDEFKGLSDDSLMSNIKEVEQVILNYCRIPHVPVQLKYTWANMVVDLSLFQIESNYTPADPLDGIDVSDLSSIKVGDTSVFVGDKYRSNLRSRILQSHNSALDEIVMNYKKQLNQFRSPLVWDLEI